MQGTALNIQDVEAALTGVDAVIVTLGVSLGGLFKPEHLFSDATRVLIAAMKDKRVNQLTCVTGFGAGGSRASIGFLQRIPFQIVFGRAYDDKSLQEQMIKESGLDWTIARPVVLLNGPKTGRYKVLREQPERRNGIISQSTVADYLVKQIEDRNFIRASPVLVS